MQDKSDVLDLVRRPHLDVLDRLGDNKPAAGQEPSDELSCPAFGFLRGVADRALALELKFANGNSKWLSYSCLVEWDFNPSVGLLLRFSSDRVSLVLIRGSCLAARINDSIDLPHGMQRHRITWVKEMTKEELRQAGTKGPTIDRIEVAGFQSQEEIDEWLKKTAPGFIHLAVP